MNEMWEYKQLNIETSGTAVLNELIRASTDGWELVSAQRIGDDTWAIFKRLITQQQFRPLPAELELVQLRNGLAALKRLM